MQSLLPKSKNKSDFLHSQDYIGAEFSLVACGGVLLLSVSGTLYSNNGKKHILKAFRFTGFGEHKLTIFIKMSKIDVDRTQGK